CALVTFQERGGKRTHVHFWTQHRAEVDPPVPEHVRREAPANGTLFARVSLPGNERRAGLQVGLELLRKAALAFVIEGPDDHPVGHEAEIAKRLLTGHAIAAPHASVGCQHARIVAQRFWLTRVLRGQNERFLHPARVSVEPKLPDSQERYVALEALGALEVPLRAHEPLFRCAGGRLARRSGKRGSRTSEQTCAQEDEHDREHCTQPGTARTHGVTVPGAPMDGPGARAPWAR